ncbi:hypothetical protein EHW99_2636 [Erwinia amylovora]|uniref:Uncharacterized protein n=2 Tax=Erwinia amylovora TaxID=552 RepID=A0A831A260_ERWAM|nr:hypothetical protein EaACW_0953 [Erwinia amylovora ACW56400]QJQ55338.1 hypothetical protein EHX00_2636 [Erwinia amylovora]CBA19894.1 hypothetical protein predicted by Glimmer/Critica [Erwinia amylovora CFBP1430]CCO77796.1 hypothetical protein BN432_0974 [Erwinia amylovora Ea356]CCO81582.1 hypothetical protein BN433_0987 [Erwinia amylovora Ea266]CCO85384.1 hypothetical protein BN434_0972 [Erwinia amylovora CFBP 2585]CCO89169.1 hypothetical protein BN435_0973 [Erwinia amylovora 01SFR-BO]CCO
MMKRIKLNIATSLPIRPATHTKKKGKPRVRPFQ